MCQLADLLGDGNIFFKRQMGSVDHNRGEAGADGSGDGQEVTVVQMDAHRNMGFVRTVLAHLDKAVTHECQFLGVDSQNDRRIQLLTGVHDTIQNDTGANIEGGNRKMICVRNLQNLVHIHQHRKCPPY